MPGPLLFFALALKNINTAKHLLGQGNIGVLGKLGFYSQAMPCHSRKNSLNIFR